MWKLTYKWACWTHPNKPKRWTVNRFFFFNDTATTEIYTLSLHDALPICNTSIGLPEGAPRAEQDRQAGDQGRPPRAREQGTDEGGHQEGPGDDRRGAQD